MKSRTNPDRGRARSNRLPISVLAVGILLTMVVGKSVRDAEAARERKVAAYANMLAAAVRRYHTEHSRLPTLQQLVRPDANGVRQLEDLLQDPWHRDYVLQPGSLPGDFVVASAGPNGTLGDDDDILSRREQR